MADWISSEASESVFPGPRFRLSWGAVFASAFAIGALELLFGVAVLAWTLRSAEPFGSIADSGALGAGLFAVVGLLATAVGGWVGGRASEARRRRDGALHGALGWAVATVAVVVMSANWAAGIARSLFETATTLVAASAPRPEVTLDTSDIRREARALADASPFLRGKSPKTNPIAAQKADGETGLDVLIDRYLAPSSPGAPVPSRATVVNVLAIRAGMPRADAERTLDRWQRTVDERRQTLSEQRAQAELRARVARAETLRSAAVTTTWAALALFFGLVAATVGGLVGAPGEEEPRAVRRESTILVEEAA